MPNKIFISYKNSKDGEPTPDAVMARELYDALTSSGMETFFSQRTLMLQGTDKYKERIDDELDQCVILVVVGTSVANINSRWVKYEWDGFYLDILNGKNGKVFTYVDGINPHNLPRALRSVQSFDKQHNSLESVVSFIQNALTAIEGVAASPEQNSGEMENLADGTIRTAFELSSLFLHSGANAIKNQGTDIIQDEISRISRLYSKIHTLKRFDTYEETKDIASSILRIIKQGCTESINRKLLKIKGPLGSYKNRLLQYLYLLIENTESGILPFYIDLAMYERSKLNHSIDDNMQLEELVNRHFCIMENLIADNRDKAPLLIIDGVRDFSSGRDKLYSYIKKRLSGLECNLVISLDTDFTNNTYHRFTLHPLAGTDYEYFIRITSLSIYDRENCIEFIKNCLDTFHIRIPFEQVDETVIYNRLVNLNVMHLDAYWLSNLLREMLGNILNESLTIADLYEAICRKTLGTASIDSAAHLAYEFEYGSIDFCESDFFFDTRWMLIRKHRSMMDFLIARYYIIKFEELDVNDTKNIQKQLHFFSMILPKAVTIFVTPMINRISSYENKVLSIATRCYDQMSVFEKNQLIFWLGRLKNRVSIEESTMLLKQYRETQKDAYLKVRSNRIKAKPHAFLLRTISVSLMVLGDRTAFDDYFELLLNDKYTNEINRAFHLTYYGDKPYIPNKSMLDFDDDVKKGKYTFEILCASIRSKIENRTFNQMLLLEVFTLCSLLQARIERSKQANRVIDIKKYAELTMRYLKWILRQRKMSEFDTLRIYFTWMQDEISKYFIHNNEYSSSGLYNEYSNARTVKRTGWVKREIPNPENIVEHMYNCWLLAAFYLPVELDDPLYDKNRIMNMLLIHDLGEVKTGDIPRPEKVIKQQYYDENENVVMQNLLLARTYPSVPDLSYFENCWECWNGKKDINYDIAKDIDNIQAIYQFCRYYQKYPDLFDRTDALDWFDGIYEIKTDIGRNLADILILNNRELSDVVEDLDDTGELF